MAPADCRLGRRTDRPAVEAVWRHYRLPPLPPRSAGRVCLLSFTLIFFRAPSLHAGPDILSAMAGQCNKGALVNWPQS